MTHHLPRHEHLDHLIREAARHDPRITHALAYGSFTQGTADDFSDLEYFVYLPDPKRLDVQVWVGRALQGSPFVVRHFFVNDFGTPNFVLDGLLRLELHAETPDRLADLAGWPAAHADLTRMSVKDTDGRLAGALRRLGTRAQPDPAAEAQGILDRLLGWLALGMNVLARGERIRPTNCWSGCRAACCGWPGWRTLRPGTGSTRRASQSGSWAARRWNATPGQPAL